MPPRPKAIVVFRRMDDNHGETILFQPLQCTRDTRRTLVQEIRGLLLTVGFVRSHVSIVEEPVSMNDPDPVPFSDMLDGGPSFRRIMVRAGHVHSVYNSVHRYNGRQFRVLRQLFKDILKRLGMRIHAVRRV